jgi:GntR family transcriptional regulator, transcriptional repressor for pyruvate dehydrogenase complex
VTQATAALVTCDWITTEFAWLAWPGSKIQYCPALAVASHNPLLYALEAFLVNLLLQLQIGPLSKRGLKHWIERSREFQNDRRKVVDAIRDRDGQRAFEAMENYLEHQRRIFAADKELSAMRLSDPKAVLAVADLVSVARGA